MSFFTVSSLSSSRVMIFGMFRTIMTEALSVCELNLDLSFLSWKPALEKTDSDGADVAGVARNTLAKTVKWGNSLSPSLAHQSRGDILSA